MAKYNFAKRLKRSIVKKLLRFITQNSDVTFTKNEPFKSEQFLTVEEAAALFIEFDKRIAAIEGRIFSKREPV